MDLGNLRSTDTAKLAHWPSWHGRIRQDTLIPQYPTICKLKKIQGYGWDTCTLGTRSAEKQLQPNTKPYFSDVACMHSTKERAASSLPGSSEWAAAVWTRRCHRRRLDSTSDCYPAPAASPQPFHLFSDFLPLSCWLLCAAVLLRCYPCCAALWMLVLNVVR